MKTRSFAAKVLPVTALLVVATPAAWADHNSPWGAGWAMDAMGMHETAIETKAGGLQATGKTVQSGKLGAAKSVPDLPDQAAQGKLSRPEPMKLAADNTLAADRDQDRDRLLTRDKDRLYDVDQDRDRDRLLTRDKDRLYDLDQDRDRDRLIDRDLDRIRDRDRLSRPELDRPTAKPDRVERIERVQPVDRPQRTERVQSVERVQRTERVQPVDRPQRTERIQSVERFQHSNRVGGRGGR